VLDMAEEYNSSKYGIYDYLGGLIYICIYRCMIIWVGLGNVHSNNLLIYHVTECFFLYHQGPFISLIKMNDP